MMSSQSLTTIPPEILLTIISHLPSSNSLHALSQTSHSLASFLHTHAAAICNTHILQHHSRAASILKSTYVDGWLVPKHHSVLESEGRWLCERSSRTPSLASQTRLLNINNCCFRTESSISSDNNTPPRLHLQTTNEPTSPLSMTHKPLPHTPHHQDLSLSLSLGLPLKLSRPGPHYLSFLERYSGEIVARRVMNSALRDTVVPTQGTRDIEKMQDPEEDRSTTHFDFMIGNYCIKKWLVMCDDVFGEGLTYLIEVEKVPRIEVLKEKIKRVLDQAKEQFKSLGGGKVRKKTKQQPPNTRVLFGEIESEDEKEKFGIEKDTWIKGLLWYYGISSQLASNIEVTDWRGKRSKTRFSKAQAAEMPEMIKGGTRMLSPMVKNTWRKMRCRGRFQLLED